MSLDVTLTAVRPTTVYDANITHNLGAMAREAATSRCLLHFVRLAGNYSITQLYDH